MILLSPLPHRLGLYPCGEALPGCAPGSAVTFFCFAKRESPKKRRAEVRAATRFLALLASGGVGLNSLRSNNARPDPPAAVLLSPATRHRRKTAGYRQPEANKDAPRRVLVGSGIRLGFPRRYEEASSTGADGSGLALFERSEFSQTPAAPSNAAYPRYARGDESGSPSFAYFSWRRTKSEAAVGPQSRHQAAPAGARPGTAWPAGANIGAS